MYNFAIALTGSIASGKSTVCSLLKLQGFAVIDADSQVHKILNTKADEIGEMFGQEYLMNGKIDRKKLGKLIFSDKAKKEKLEDFMHPLVQKAILEESEKLELYKFPYIIDIPLFFETKNYDIEKVVVVYAPREIILDRLVKREGLSESEAISRLNLQMDIEKKKKIADFMIDNSKNLRHLQSEVDIFAEKLKKITKENNDRI